MLYQKFEQLVELAVVMDNQVDISIPQRNGQTLPRIKREFIHLIFLDRVEMLPEQPESTVLGRPDHESGHILDAAAGPTLFWFVFLIRICGLIIMNYYVLAFDFYRTWLTSKILYDFI
jgi:hypothetical protein